MRFRFTLEPVLRVAEVRDTCERRKLEALQVEIAAALADRQSLVQAQLAAHEELASATNTSAAWLRIIQQSIEAAGERIGLIDQRLRGLHNDLAQQRRVYIEKRRNAELLRNLRSTQYAEFRREAERREQAVHDDVFLNRYR